VRGVWEGLFRRVERLPIVIQIGRCSGTGSGVISGTGVQGWAQVQFSGRVIQVRVDGRCDWLHQRAVNEEEGQANELQSQFVKKKCVGHVPTLRESDNGQRIVVDSKRE